MLGASRVSGSLCDAAGYVACLADFGSRLNNDITDLLHSRCIVNWGRDLSAAPFTRPHSFGGRENLDRR